MLSLFGITYLHKPKLQIPFHPYFSGHKLLYLHLYVYVLIIAMGTFYNSAGLNRQHKDLGSAAILSEK